MKASDHQGQEGVKIINQTYLFYLFVYGNESKSVLARENLKQICQEYLADRCQIRTIDVLQDFEEALKNNIYVTPALIKMSPEPRVAIFGSLSDKGKVISALHLQ